MTGEESQSQVRSPVEIVVNGRRIRISPGLRFPGGLGQESEYIWIADSGFRRASGATPEEAARKVAR